MDQQIQKISPDYTAIFTDIIVKKEGFIDLKYKKILEKNNLTSWEIINLNNQIFGKKDTVVGNSKLKSYNKKDIYEALIFQRKHKLNNSQLAKKFKISRNTISKWKKHFNQINFSA